jgi:DNA-binding SARP family transcriptional activator/tetratricopeptide (TPR) repeat protein
MDSFAVGEGIVRASFRLLGPVSLLHGDRTLDIGGPTARAVMAVLLLRGQAGVTIEGLRDAVWGAEGASRESVYHYVSSLRSALAAAGTDAAVEGRRPGYRMVVAADAVDWHRFKRLVTLARRARDGGNRDEAAELLTAARKLWFGSPLEGIGDRLAGPRREMQEAHLVATEDLAAVEAARGRPDQVVELLEQAAADHPGRERTTRLLIDALVALGRHGETGVVYLRTHRFLAEHHGLSPSAALTAAYEAGLRADKPQAHPRTAARSAHASPAEAQSVGAQSADVGHGPSGLEPLPLPAIFTGRGIELDRVVAALQPIPSSRPAVCGISGMPGVGKTTLALHAARSLAHAYPGGCLFVDLHGFTTGSRPENPGDVLDRLLRRLGVSGEHVPHHLDDRAALWRQRLNGRQVLLILDDVRDVAQARPLLPQVPGCGTLITSRVRLAALDEAELIGLGVLPAVDGAALFRSVAGARLSSEPDSAAGVDRIVAACGGLPLAIRIAAARFRTEPDPLTDLCARLEDQQARLAELDDGDRSVFSTLTLSYAALPPDLQRAFALLGVHPGTDLELHAAAALVDRPLVATRRLLTGLVERHLLTSSGPGRYRLHDLVGAFARECLTAARVGEARARQRLVAYHLQVAELADAAITPHRYRIPLALTYRARAVPDVRSPEEAVRWLIAREQVLVELCREAAGHGLDVQCWQLAYTLRGYFFLTKRWQPWVETHETALAAARRLGDVRAEALTLNNLGLAAMDQGQPRLAQDRYRRALTLFGQVGDEHGETTARANLAWIHFDAGRYREFLGELWPAHAFYERSGSHRNAAITLRGIALGEIEVGELDGAVEHLEQVRQVFEELELDLDRAMALNALGEAHSRRGEPGMAGTCHGEALEVSLRCGSMFEAARAHHRLGDLASAAGDPPGARRHWEEAARGYGLLNALQLDEIRGRLARPGV